METKVTLILGRGLNSLRLKMGGEKGCNMAQIWVARTRVFITGIRRSVAGTSRKQKVWDGGSVQASRCSQREGEITTGMLQLCPHTHWNHHTHKGASRDTDKPKVPALQGAIKELGRYNYSDESWAQSPRKAVRRPASHPISVTHMLRGLEQIASHFGTSVSLWSLRSLAKLD